MVLNTEKNYLKNGKRNYLLNGIIFDCSYCTNCNFKHTMKSLFEKIYDKISTFLFDRDVVCRP